MVGREYVIYVIHLTKDIYTINLSLLDGFINLCYTQVEMRTSYSYCAVDQVKTYTIDHLRIIVARYCYKCEEVRAFLDWLEAQEEIDLESPHT